MITDLIKFLNGEITTANKTSNKIILSNGKEYNHKLFHQSIHIVRAMLNYDKDESEEALQIKQTLKDLKASKLLAEKEKIKKETEDIAKLKLSCKDDLSILKTYPILIGFGKYKGQYSNKIYDEKYLSWLLGVRPIENFSKNADINVPREAKSNNNIAINTPKATINVEIEEDETPY